MHQEKKLIVVCLCILVCTLKCVSSGRGEVGIAVCLPRLFCVTLLDGSGIQICVHNLLFEGISEECTFV